MQWSKYAPIYIGIGRPTWMLRGPALIRKHRFMDNPGLSQNTFPVLRLYSCQAE
jgi:hypothetical protein